MQHWKLKGNQCIYTIAKIFHILFDFDNLLFIYIIHNLLNSKKTPSFKGLTNTITKQQSSKICSKKKMTNSRNFCILISSIDFLRVTSHQCLELWRIRGKKIIRRGAIPLWIVSFPPVCLSYRVGPVYSIEYLSSFHRVTYQPVLSVRVHECNAADQLKGTRRLPWKTRFFRGSPSLTP